jgi:hypothetical protein
MNPLVAAVIFFAVVGGIMWLAAPKNEQELNDYLKRKCEQRGGVYYDQDLGNGVHKVCHGV